MVDCLAETGATYATDSVSHALKLASRGFEVIVLGGSLKSATQAVVGPDTNSAIARYHFTLGFWGANGITREDGFTTPDAAEAEVKRLSMRQTLHRFVLADASKADRVSRVTFADFEDATGHECPSRQFRAPGLRERHGRGRLAAPAAPRARRHPASPCPSRLCSSLKEIANFCKFMRTDAQECAIIPNNEQDKRPQGSEERAEAPHDLHRHVQPLAGLHRPR